MCGCLGVWTKGQEGQMPVLGGTDIGDGAIETACRVLCTCMIACMCAWLSVFEGLSP